MIPRSSPQSSKSEVVPVTNTVDEHDGSTLGAPVKIALALSGLVCVPIVAIVVWYVAIRDDWEAKNAVRVSEQVEEADRIRKADPFAAYKIYDETLQEAKTHEITNERLSRTLAQAQKARNELHEQVQESIRAEKIEKQRQAEQEQQRLAAERHRIAEEQNRQREEEEAARLAEVEIQKEAQRREQRVAAYRDVPRSARDALNALKRIEAKIEVGLTFRDYTTVIGDGWADVKIFIESDDGGRLVEFSGLLTNAIGHYKLALDIWNNEIKHSDLYGDRSDVEALRQACWLRAGERIELASALLDTQTTLEALKDFSAVTENEEDLEAAWKKIEKGALNRRKN